LKGMVFDMEDGGIEEEELGIMEEDCFAFKIC
jgi:hypothetical protein